MKRPLALITAACLAATTACGTEDDSSGASNDGVGNPTASTGAADYVATTLESAATSEPPDVRQICDAYAVMLLIAQRLTGITDHSRVNPRFSDPQMVEEGQSLPSCQVEFRDDVNSESFDGYVAVFAGPEGAVDLSSCEVKDREFVGFSYGYLCEGDLNTDQPRRAVVVRGDRWIIAIEQNFDRPSSAMLASEDQMLAEIQDLLRG